MTTIYSQTRKQAAEMSTARLKRWKRGLHAKIGRLEAQGDSVHNEQQKLNAVEKELKEREEREQHL